jgi:alkylation response protein AidB-like acyl-CoA dehydrogenase
LFELEPAVEFHGHAAGTAARAFDRGALGTAAQLCGLADRMIEMTVEYVKERKQFGVPVGSQQAVKHHLANARLALEFARPLVYRAAYSIAHDDPQRSDHVSMAKAQASDAAETAARVALQCHGAIGYTTEYDLHLYMKRTWALARAWGDAAWHRARVERRLFEGAPNA